MSFNVDRLKTYAIFGIFANVVAVIPLALIALDGLSGRLSNKAEPILPFVPITAILLFFSTYVIWSHFYSEEWKLRRELKILELQKEVDNLETSIANQSGGNRD